MSGQKLHAPPCSIAPTPNRACFEEAMRRYGLKYHVVGGFSFYERSEIKDMISYLKVIHNPDDSISLLRRHQHAHARHRQRHDRHAGTARTRKQACRCGGDRRSDQAPASCRSELLYP